jgi:hypothetical protein
VSAAFAFELVLWFIGGLLLGSVLYRLMSGR